ncbi:hypothetical protein V8C40DRAFT_248719 [Trichoderma camerunense]
MPMGAKGSTRHLESSGDTCCVRRAGGTSHSPSRAKAALTLTCPDSYCTNAPSHLVQCDGCSKSYESNWNDGILQVVEMLVSPLARRTSTPWLQ